MANFNIWGDEFLDVLTEMQEGQSLLASLTPDLTNNEEDTFDYAAALSGSSQKVDALPVKSLPDEEDTFDYAAALSSVDSKRVIGRDFISTPTSGLPVVKGNIDLDKLTPVTNKDGSVSTVRTISINEDGLEVVIPTVVDGKVLGVWEAIDHYRETGEHFGKFKSVEDANRFAEQLHKNEEDKLVEMPAFETLHEQEVGIDNNFDYADAILTPEERQLKRYNEFINTMEMATVDVYHMVDKEVTRKEQQKIAEFNHTMDSLNDAFMNSQDINAPFDIDNPEHIKIAGHFLTKAQVEGYKSHENPEVRSMGFQLEALSKFFDNAVYINSNTHDIIPLPILLVQSVMSEGKEDINRGMYELLSDDKVFERVSSQVENPDALGYLASMREMFKEMHNKEGWATRDWNEFMRSMLSEMAITAVISFLPNKFGPLGMLISLGAASGVSLWQSNEIQRGVNDAMYYLQTMPDAKRKKIIETGYRPEFIDDQGNVLTDEVTKQTLAWVDTNSPHRQSVINIEEKATKIDKNSIYGSTLLNTLSGAIFALPEYGIAYKPASFAGDISGNTLVQLISFAANYKKVGAMAFTETLKRLLAVEINENIRNVIIGKSAEFVMNDVGILEMIDGSPLQNFNLLGMNVPTLTASLLSGAVGQRMVGGAIYGGLDYTQKIVSKQLMIKALENTGYISSVLSKHPDIKTFLERSVGFLDLVNKNGDLQETAKLINNQVFKNNELVVGVGTKPTEDRMNEFVQNLGQILGVEVSPESVKAILQKVLLDSNGKVNQERLSALEKEIRDVATDTSRPYHLKVNEQKGNKTSVSVVETVPLEDKPMLSKIIKGILSGSNVPKEIVISQTGRVMFADVFSPANQRLLIQSTGDDGKKRTRIQPFIKSSTVTDDLAFDLDVKLTETEVKLVNDILNLSSGAARADGLDVDAIKSFILEALEPGVKPEEFTAKILTLTESLMSRFGLSSSVRGKIEVQDTAEAKHMEAFNTVSLLYGLTRISARLMDDKPSFEQTRIIQSLVSVLDTVYTAVKDRGVVELPEPKMIPFDASGIQEYIKNLEGSEPIAKIFRDAGVIVPDYKTATTVSQDIGNLGYELIKTLVYAFALNKGIEINPKHYTSKGFLDLIKEVLFNNEQDFANFLQLHLSDMLRFGRGSTLDILGKVTNGADLPVELLKNIEILNSYIKTLIETETPPKSVVSIEELKAKISGSELTAVESLLSEISENKKTGIKHLAEPLKNIFDATVDFRKKVQKIADDVVFDIQQYGINGVTTEQLAMLGKIAVNQMFEGNPEGFSLLLTMGAMHHANTKLVDAQSEWLKDASFQGVSVLLSRMNSFFIPESMVKFAEDKFGVNIRNTVFVDGFNILMGFNSNVFKRLFGANTEGDTPIFKKAKDARKMLLSRKGINDKYLVPKGKKLSAQEKEIQIASFDALSKLLSVILSREEGESIKGKSTRIIGALIGKDFEQKVLKGVDSEKVIRELNVRLIYSDLVNELRGLIRQSVMDELHNIPEIKEMFIDKLKLSEMMLHDVLSDKNIESYIRRMFAHDNFKSTVLSKILPQTLDGKVKLFSELMELKTEHLVKALSGHIDSTTLEKIKVIGSAEWKDAMTKFYGSSRHVDKYGKSPEEIRKIYKTQSGLKNFRNIVEDEILELYDRAVANYGVDFLGIFRAQDVPTKEATLDKISDEMSILKLSSFYPEAMKFLGYTDTLDGSKTSIPQWILTIKSSSSPEKRLKALEQLKTQLLGYRTSVMNISDSLMDLFNDDVLKFFREQDLKVIDSMLENVNKLLDSAGKEEFDSSGKKIPTNLDRFINSPASNLDSWVTTMLKMFEHDGVGSMGGIVKNLLSNMFTDRSGVTRSQVTESIYKTYVDMVSNSTIFEAQKLRYTLNKLTGNFITDKNLFETMINDLGLFFSHVKTSDMVRSVMHAVFTPLFATSPEFKELNKRSKLFVENYNARFNMARSYIIDNPDKSKPELKAVYQELLNMSESEALELLVNSFSVKYPEIYKPRKTESEKVTAKQGLGKSQEDAKDFLNLLRALDSAELLDDFIGYSFKAFASKEMTLDTKPEAFTYIDGLLQKIIDTPKMQEFFVEYMGAKYDVKDAQTKIDSGEKVNILELAGINIKDAHALVGLMGQDIVGALMSGAMTDVNVLKLFQKTAPRWTASILQIKTAMASLTHLGIMEGIYGIKEVMDNPRYLPLLYTARGLEGLKKLRNNDASNARIIASMSNHYISSKSKLFFGMVPELKIWFDEFKSAMEAMKAEGTILSKDFYVEQQTKLLSILTKGIFSDIPMSIRLIARHIFDVGHMTKDPVVSPENLKRIGLTQADLRTIPFFTEPQLASMVNTIFKDVYTLLVDKKQGTFSKIFSSAPADIDTDAFSAYMLKTFNFIPKWLSMMDRLFGTGEGHTLLNTILTNMWSTYIVDTDASVTASKIFQNLFQHANFRDDAFVNHSTIRSHMSKVLGGRVKDRTQLTMDTVMTATNKALAERGNIDPSFRDILWPITNPIDAALGVVQRVINSSRSKQYVADLLQSTNAVHMVFSSGDSLTKKNVYGQLSHANYKEVSLGSLLRGEHGDFGTQLGKSLLASSEFLSRVEAIAWDKIDARYKEAQGKFNVDDMDALSRMFFEDDFVSRVIESKALAYDEALKSAQDTKVYINASIWDEIEMMGGKKISLEPTTKHKKTVNDVIDVVEDTLSDLRYYYSGAVLMLNNVSWERNIIGALLTPIYALSPGAFVKYVPIAVKTILSSGTKGATEMHAEYRVRAKMVPMASAKFGAMETGRSRAATRGAGEKGIVKGMLSIGLAPLKFMVDTSFKGLSKALNTIAPEKAAKIFGLDSIDEFTLNARMRTLYGMVDEITKFSIYMAAREGAIKTPEYVRNPALKSLAKFAFKDNPKILSDIKRMDSHEYYHKMNPDEALRFAEQFSFVYYELPTMWRIGRSVVNPFISFVYNAGKITGNALLQYPMKTAFVLGMLGQINEQMERRWGIGLNLNMIVPGLDWMDRMKEMMAIFTGADGVPYRAESMFNAPIGKFIYIMSTGRDPFTGQSVYYPNEISKKFIGAYMQSFAPVPPTPDLAVRSLFHALDRVAGSSQYYDLVKQHTDILLPESWLTRKVLEQGIRQQAVDSYGTRISPLIALIYGLTGLNITIQDQIKMNTIIDNKMFNLQRNVEKISELEVLDPLDTPRNIPKEIANLKSENKKLQNDIVYYLRKTGMSIPSWLEDGSSEFFGVRLMRFLSQYYLNLLGIETPEGVAPRSIGRQ